MSIQFTCPSCHIAMQAPDDAAGKTKRCRNCGGTVTVPSPAVDFPIADLVKPSPAEPTTWKPSIPVSSVHRVSREKWAWFAAGAVSGVLVCAVAFTIREAMRPKTFLEELQRNVAARRKNSKGEEWPKLLKTYRGVAVSGVETVIKDIKVDDDWEFRWEFREGPHWA